MGAGPIRASTGGRRTKPTSTGCRRLRQPEPGRRSTYQAGEPVQTNRASSEHRQYLFGLYADEFQHFASDMFADFILETRKHGCAVTLAHQERIGQFGENEKILAATAACANKVFFQTTVKDAQEFAPEFAAAPVTETKPNPHLAI